MPKIFFSALGRFHGVRQLLPPGGGGFGHKPVSHAEKPVTHPRGGGAD